MEPIFDRPSKCTFYYPYIIDFPVGSNAVGHIVLDEDCISEMLKECKV